MSKVFKYNSLNLFEYNKKQLNNKEKRKLKWQGKFIRKARKIHKEKYNYKLVKYIKIDVKVKIICSIHGVFTQTPDSHLNGRGC